MKLNLRLLYLYLFSFVGLIIVVIGSVQMVNIGLKTLVFKDAYKYTYYEAPRVVPLEKQEGVEELSQDELAEQERRQELEQKRGIQRELSNAIAMIVVGLPLYLYHWRVIQRENK